MTDWREDVYSRNPHLRYRDHSYEAQRTIPVGSHVRLVDDVKYYKTIPAGTTGIVTSYSNAGFRGIEATILLDVPLPSNEAHQQMSRDLGIPVENSITRLHGISAGKLEVIEEG